MPHFLLSFLAVCCLGLACPADTPLLKPPPGLGLAQEPAIPLLLEGWYKLAGHQGKRTYAGMAMLRKLGENYLVTYAIEDGVSVVGVGFRPTEDSLVVGWATEGPKQRGVTVYRLRPKGILQGRWAGLPTDGKQHQETLTFSHALPVAAEEE